MKGLIFNLFEHSFNENCRLAFSSPRFQPLHKIITTKKLAVNVSHFLPLHFPNQIPSPASHNFSESSLQKINFSENISK